MAKDKKAVHVAIIKREYKGRVYETTLLRRTFREDGKVKHETLANLSHLPRHIIDIIRRSLQGETFVSAEASFEVLRSLPHGHVKAVLETLRRCGLADVIRKRADRKLNLIEAMIVMRVIEPCSKLACAQALTDETASNSLGQVLGLEGVKEDELYATLDWLLAQQERIENALAATRLTNGSLVLYDVTSTYFEGRHCPLAKRGHSRDGRRDRPQIVVGLLCDSLGCPVAVEVFEGNTADPRTVSSQIEKLRTRFGLTNVVVVGDRGMLTEARIREDLRPHDIDWISSLRAPAIRDLVLQGSLQLSLFEETDLAEITHPDFPGERLVACRNPLLAEERGRKREDLLACTERDLEKLAEATRRQRRPLRGKDKIGFRLGRVLGRFKMAKHFLCDIQDEGFTYQRNDAAITQEAALDGIYVVRTSLSKDALSAEATVQAYKELAFAERAFRCLKTMDLRLRPIHHRLPDRVRGHVFLCMLAYYVEWHMRRALAPILFEDDQKERARARRQSIVAPAQRSEDALEKARTKRTSGDEPVQSFQRLLKTLATLTRNTVSFQGASFIRYSTPTSIQRRALELLEITSLG